MPSINTELGERALSKMQHEMDWKPLKERCLRVYPTWSSRHVDRILREYQRFLALKVATRDIYDTIVLAPRLLDAMWKQHILSTQQYSSDCQVLLQSHNQILHYNVDAQINVSASVREKRMELTKASLCMMFAGTSLSSDARGIWEYHDDDDLQEQEETEGEDPQEISSSTMGSASSYIGGDDDEVDVDDDEQLLEDIHHHHHTRKPPQNDMPPHKTKIKSKSPRKDLRTRKNNHKSNNKPTQLQPQPQLQAGKDSSPQQQQQQQQSRRLVLYIYRAGKVSKLSTYSHETILHVKTKIQRKMGLPPSQQCLEWDGLELISEERTIAQYGIPHDATLVLSKITRIPSSSMMMVHDNDDDNHNHHLVHIQQQQQPIKGKASQVMDHHDHEKDEYRVIEERDDDDNVGPDARPTRRGRSSSRAKPNAMPMTTRPPKPPSSSSLRHQPPYNNSKSEDLYSSYPYQQQHHHDPRRRQQQQQTMSNKLKMQNHRADDTDDDDADHDDDILGITSSLEEHDSTIPPRPRPKPAAPPPPPPNNSPIKVFINTIMGFTINLTAKASDTVLQLKRRIQEQEDIPSKKQILILDGVPLDDSQYLTDYTAVGSSDLHVLLRLQAGTGNSVMSASSIVSVSASGSPNSTSMMSTMATNAVAMRKKNQNKILARTSAA